MRYTVKSLRNKLRQVFCKHEYRFRENFYASSAVKKFHNSSSWCCGKCKDVITRPYLLQGPFVCTQDFVGLSMAEAQARRPYFLKIVERQKRRYMKSISPHLVVVELDNRGFITLAMDSRDDVPNYNFPI